MNDETLLDKLRGVQKSLAYVISCLADELPPIEPTDHFKAGAVTQWAQEMLVPADDLIEFIDLYPLYPEKDMCSKTAFSRILRKSFKLDQKTGNKLYIMNTTWRSPPVGHWSLDQLRELCAERFRPQTRAEVPLKVIRQHFQKTGRKCDPTRLIWALSGLGFKVSHGGCNGPAVPGHEWTESK